MTVSKEWIYVVMCTDEDSYDNPLFATDSIETAERLMKQWVIDHQHNPHWRLESIGYRTIQWVGTEVEEAQRES